MANPTIVKFDNCEIILTDLAAGAHDLHCHAKAVRMPATATEVITFCTGTQYSYETIEVTAFQSYGTDGLWALLGASAGEEWTYVIRPNGPTVSVDNPQAAGTLRIPGIDFVGGDVKAYQTMDLVFETVGDPVFSII